ncbi:MFS transporter [Pseudonocardiaceae bacterium YIM PH 21723]|nr:MFS transporter [Pseudonocardiaceae bacterium YIM PH 21723]
MDHRRDPAGLHDRRGDRRAGPATPAWPIPGRVLDGADRRDVARPAVVRGADAAGRDRRRLVGLPAGWRTGRRGAVGHGRPITAASAGTLRGGNSLASGSSDRLADRTANNGGGTVLKGLPRLFWWVWVSVLIQAIGGFAWPLMSVYVHDRLGYSLSFAGWVLTAMGAGATVGPPVLGSVADRWGRRPVSLIGQFIAALGLIGLAELPGKPMLLVSAFLFGFGAWATKPVRSAVIADVVEPEDRLRAFSLNYWAINIGFGVAAGLGGLLAGYSMRWVFLANAALMVLSGLVQYVMVPETLPPHSPAVHRRESALRLILADRTFLAFLFACLLFFCVLNSPTIALAPTMAAHGLSVAMYGVVAAVNGVAITVLQLPANKILAGRRASQAMAFGAVVIGVGMAINLVAHNVWVFGLSVLVWTIGEMVYFSFAPAVVAGFAPPHMRARYQSAFSMASYAGMIAAPLMFGYTMQYLGSSAVWWLCLAIGLLVALTIRTVAVRLDDPGAMTRIGRKAEAQVASA